MGLEARIEACADRLSAMPPEPSMSNSFNAKTALHAAGQDFEIFKLDAVPNSARLPYSLKILLENLLRNEDGVTVTRWRCRWPRTAAR